MFSDINSKNGKLIRTGKIMSYSLTCFTILTGEKLFLLNSVQEWLLGCF